MKSLAKKKWSIRWTDTSWNEIKFPAPNTEEVIEFLLDAILGIEIKKSYTINGSKIYTIYAMWYWATLKFTWKKLLEALEATLEYLLDNWYIYETKTNWTSRNT